MWSLLFLCIVLITHGVQGAGWYSTAFVTETEETSVQTIMMTSPDQQSTTDVYTEIFTETGVTPSTDGPCGGFLYGNKGTISSPNYPNNYPNNKDCVWYIRTYGHGVKLSFTHVNIEYEPSCRYDAIYVYDGSSTGSTLLGKICGTQIYNFFSTTASITVRFITDGSITRSGFEASYKVMDEPCGNFLYGNNGTFSSPNYPNYYLNDYDCFWYIRTNGNIVQLNFTHVDIEYQSNCHYDAIYVYDETSTGSRFLGKICGTQRPTFYSTTASLTVRFITDGSITLSGFEASYKVIDSVQRSCRDNCGNHMGSCSCFDSCQNNENCCHDYSWYCYHTTSPTTATTAQPSCRYNCGYHLGSCSCRSSCQYNGNCCRDYNRFCYHTTYAPYTAQPSCRYNCGRHMGSCSCSSSCRYYGNCCHDYDSYCYTTTPWPHITHWYTTAKPCGGYLFGSGTFSSPNHPDHYDNHNYCVWQLRASHDQRIYITFDFVELENCCSCDYISVLDGSSVNSRLLGKVCNGNTASFFSSNQYMTVVFRTDSSVVARGFKAEFMSTLRSSSGRVKCSSDNMKIVISRSYLNSLGYDGQHLYLNDPSCRPYYNSNYEVVFNYFITSCGNVRKIDNGTVTYTNNVGAYKFPSFSEITRQKHFELIVNCRMDKDSVSQIVYIVNQPDSNSIIGSGKFNTSMDFYTSSNFYYKVTQRPYYVSLNEYMYVQVDLRDPNGGLVIFLDTCVTSPSADDFYSRPYYLVRDGCPADSTYYAYISGTRSYARFRFKSFQFLRASQTVYIQCTVLICPASDNNSRCRRGCMRRRARDLGSDQDSQTMVLGPIQLKDPEKKEEGSDEQSKA